MERSQVKTVGTTQTIFHRGRIYLCVTLNVIVAHSRSTKSIQDKVHPLTYTVKGAWSHEPSHILGQDIMVGWPFAFLAAFPSENFLKIILSECSWEQPQNVWSASNVNPAITEGLNPGPLYFKASTLFIGYHSSYIALSYPQKPCYVFISPRIRQSLNYGKIPAFAIRWYNHSSVNNWQTANLNFLHSLFQKQIMKPGLTKTITTLCVKHKKNISLFVVN